MNDRDYQRRVCTVIYNAHLRHEARKRRARRSIKRNFFRIADYMLTDLKRPGLIILALATICTWSNAEVVGILLGILGTWLTVRSIN